MAASRQTIKYGTAEFPFNRIRFSERVEYDTDNRVIVGTRYRITVSGYVVEADPEAFLTEINKIRIEVAKPQRDFSAYDAVTDTYLFQYTANNVADWGPRVTQFEVEELTGVRAARYLMVVELMVKECDVNDVLTPINNPPTPGAGEDFIPGTIVNYTRSYNFSVDVVGLTTRTVQGTLTCTTQAAPADQYRHLVDLPLPGNFRRTQQVFSQSPDGLKLTYAITDKEVHYTLPSAVITIGDPASDETFYIADGEASMMVKVAPFGARVDYTLQGRFRAARSVPKGAIYQAIVDLANARFPNPLVDTSFVFTNTQVQDTIYDNEVSFVINGFTAALNLANRQSNLTAAFERFSIPPPSDGKSFLTPLYGDTPSDSGSVARLTPAYDACAPVYGDPPVPAEKDNRASGEDGVVTPIENPSDPDYQEDVSDVHKASPYIAFHEVLSWELDNNVVMFEPKVVGQEPVYQQTAPAKVMITQAGYSVVDVAQGTNSPPPPDPIDSTAIMMQSSVQMGAPEPVGSGGTNRYTVHWRYVMRRLGTIDWTDPDDRPDEYYRFPIDARRKTPETNATNPWKDNSAFPDLSPKIPE